MKTEYKFLLTGRLDMKALEAIKDYCLMTAGGYTVQYADSEGAWRDPATGTVHYDIHLTLFVACDNDAQAYQIETFARNLLKQIAIYTVKMGEVLT